MSIIDKLKRKLLKVAQNQVTKEYEKNGLTDDVLEAQLFVNEMRNKYNINDSDDEFVQ